MTDSPKGRSLAGGWCERVTHLQPDDRCGSGRQPLPLLFSTLLSDLPSTINDLVCTISYADDVVLFSRSRKHLQSALRTLEAYSKTNGVLINADETKLMKFGRDGFPATRDVFNLAGLVIEKVNSFFYLRLEINRKGTSFARHSQQRVRKARLASTSIPKPQDLSLDTTLRLFDMKILSIASYGIQITWEHLTMPQLDCLDELKAGLLKLALAVHRSSRNRLVYRLADTPSLTKDLQRRFSLPVTKTFTDHREKWLVKMTEVDEGFLCCPAMMIDDWKNAQYRDRHRLMRGAIHGFHNRICTRRHSHDPDFTCTCALCESLCREYHLYECKNAKNMDRDA